MESPLHRIRRFLSWHRRAIAALLAGLAMFALAQQLTPAPVNMVPAVVVADAAAAGSILEEPHLKVTSLPADALPADHYSNIDEVIGQTLGFGLSPGTVIQPGMLAATPQLAAGRALVPILVRDDALRELLSPGSLVTLVLSTTTEVITNDARVAVMPATDQGGLFKVSSDKPLLLVDVPAELGPSVAALGQSGQLSVILGHLDQP